MALAAHALAALVAGAVVTAAQAPSWAAQVDRVFQPWDTRDSPGCALGVFQDGQIAYARGYGLADLEHDVPITPASVFYVGSLSKQFTAMTAALAIQQGTLAHDDSIRRYLPELPAYADTIKVSHLLHHTSGLRDYNTLLDIAGRRGDEAYDNPTVLRITARQKKLNFIPGDEYLYSNTGYTLLATIVERATKMPFASYADANIFKPLGMTITHYHTDTARLVRARAMAYEGMSGAWTLDTPSNERAGAGGLYTNIPDLQRWDENFYTARVGGPDVIREVQTPARLNDGKAIAYGWGLQVGSYRGARIVEHGGALGGYRAHLLRFPEHHTSVAILCNLGSIDPSVLARRVADAVLGDRLHEAAPPPAQTRRTPAPSYAGPVGSPDAYTGTYSSDEIDATFTILTDRGRLALQRETDAGPVPLEPAGADAYRARGFLLRFQRDAAGRVIGFSVDAGRVRDVAFVRRP